MRNEPNVKLDKYRINPPGFQSPPGAAHGCFRVRHKNIVLRVISSGFCDSAWEHVSVSLENRCPTWDEMQFIKDLFFRDTETVVQFHPAKAQHINVHPYCLHLWRRVGADHELPPSDYV